MKPNFRFSFSLFFFILYPFLSQGMGVDSITTPKLWLKEKNEIGQKLLRESQEFGEAVKVFKSAHDFAATHQLAEQFIEICVGYGISLYKKGDIENAYQMLTEILPKIENSDLKLKAEVNQIIGMTLVFKDRFPEGYKYQMEALKYYTDMGDSTGVMNIYYDLGSNFGSQNQIELSLEHYEKGLAIARSINDIKNIILGTTSLSGTWASLNDIEKALNFNDESMKLAKKINDREELAWASIHRGHILSKIQEFEKAEHFLKQANDLSFEIGNKLLTAYSLEQISDMKAHQNQLDDAISLLNESLLIFQELGQTNSIKAITKKYADIYFKQKKYNKYRSYTEKYIALKDSLYSKEMAESMASLKQDYEIHKIERENQIALLTKDQELANAKHYSNILITCGAMLISLLILIMMYIRNRSAIEKNEILKAKNAEILRQNDSLANSNQDLEKFAYIISHDLKEPLRNINGFTKLLNRKLKTYAVDKDINEYASFIINGTHQMSELLNGLLTYSKIGVEQGDKSKVILDHTVFKVLNSLRIQLREKNCEVEVKDLPDVYGRSSQLTQVFQNLVANAIKFSDKEYNKISIGVENQLNEYCFFIKDEGIGIEPEYQKDIFIVFKRLHNRGTYTGSGIGLATCKKIIEEHGGRIWVKSEKGKGSCFYFTLPKVEMTENVESLLELETA